MHRAERNSVVELHFLGGDDKVVAQTVVDSRLHSVHDGLARGLGPLEIEAQTVRGIFGATLGSLRAELFAQSLMHHVCCGVSASDGATTLQVDIRVDRGTDHERAFGQTALMDDQILDGLLHVVDFKHRAVVGDNLALVGELTASLGVEGGAVEDDLDVRRAGHRRHRTLAFLHDAEHGGTARKIGVSEEVDRLGERLLEIVVDAQINVVALLERVGACTGLLFVHELAELRLVDLNALFLGHFKGELNREAVGIVELEGVLTGDFTMITLGLIDRDVKNRGAAFQRPQEGVFLTVCGFRNLMEGVLEFRIIRFHCRFRDREECGQHVVAHTEHTHGAHGSAQQTTQHVATTDVARTHAVGHDHEGGTHMIGHDAEAHIRVSVFTVGTAGEFLRGLDDREDLIGLVDVLFALHEVRETFQTGAGIDVLVLQLADDMQVGLGLDVVNLVVFENEIPDFDEPVFVSRGAAVTPVFRAAVNVNLGAGAAGAGAASGPEVVFHTEHLHMFGVEAFVLPDRTRFLIVGEGGNPELFGVETVAALVLRGGQQLPRVMNCLLLEVITEGEVAQHLEESAVAGGFSDLVDIERTHALLVRGHARGGRRLLTEQVRDERHHACNGEQGCRVR